MFRRPIFMVLVAFWGAACEPPLSPGSAPIQLSVGDGAVITAQMTDPCPGCEGIFLTGAAADNVYCILAASVDQDHDGVDDRCEQLIAQAFAPELVFHPHENSKSRETYWAVRQDPSRDGRTVRVAYLLGYHDDPDHSGDSEYIELTIQFDNTLTTGGVAGRWRTTQAWYSAHLADDAPWIPAWKLSWVGGQFGDRPISWVAKGKHSNYRSEVECEAGFLAWTTARMGFGKAWRPTTAVTSVATTTDSSMKYEV